MNWIIFIYVYIKFFKSGPNIYCKVFYEQINFFFTFTIITLLWVAPFDIKFRTLRPHCWCRILKYKTFSLFKIWTNDRVIFPWFIIVHTPFIITKIFPLTFFGRYFFVFHVTHRIRFIPIYLSLSEMNINISWQFRIIKINLLICDSFSKIMKHHHVCWIIP